MIFTALCFGVALVWALVAPVPQTQYGSLVVSDGAGPFAFAGGIGCLRLMTFPCPRCGEAFMKTKQDPPGVRNPFAQACMNCGLRKWHDPQG